MEDKIQQSGQVLVNFLIFFIKKMKLKDVKMTKIIYPVKENSINFYKMTVFFETTEHP